MEYRIWNLRFRHYDARYRISSGVFHSVVITNYPHFTYTPGGRTYRTFSSVCCAPVEFQSRVKAYECTSRYWFPIPACFRPQILLPLLYLFIGTSILFCFLVKFLSIYFLCSPLNRFQWSKVRKFTNVLGKCFSVWDSWNFGGIQIGIRMFKSTDVSFWVWNQKYIVKQVSHILESRNVPTDWNFSSVNSFEYLIFDLLTNVYLILCTFFRSNFSLHMFDPRSIFCCCVFFFFFLSHSFPHPLTRLHDIFYFFFYSVIKRGILYKTTRVTCTCYFPILHTHYNLLVFTYIPES